MINEFVKPTVFLTAYCLDCRRKHAIKTTPGVGLLGEMDRWQQKHLGHRIEFATPRRLLPKGMDDRSKWLDFQPNVDIKLAYAASAAYTITLASLASSATLVAGRESTAVSNTTNLYLDYLISAQITVGTTPTANTQIEVFAYGSYNDTPLYPDVLDGTDSNETFANADIKNQSCTLLEALAVDSATSNRAYFMRPTSLADAFGQVPKNHGVFVVHSTVAALNSTGGNHILSHTGVYVTG